MSRVSSLASLALVVASALGAQEPSRRIGFGTSLNPAALIVSGLNSMLVFPSGFSNILLPIRERHFTIEPEFGGLRVATKQSVQTGPSTFTEATSTFTNVRLGVGILKQLKQRDNLEPYVGPRFGYIRSTTKQTSPFSASGEETRKASSWYASGALGAQYFFTKHFSLGGEAAVTYTRVGDEETTGPGASPNQPQSSRTVIGTAGLVMLRCYF